MKDKEISFFSMLHRFGIKRILFSIDLWLALILVVIFVLLALRPQNAITLLIMSSHIFLTVSLALVAVSLAGLAIIASLSDPMFTSWTKGVARPRNSNVYDNVLFAFWFVSFLGSISLVFSILGYFSAFVTINSALASVLTILIVFSATYAVFATMGLLWATFKWGIYRADFLRIVSK